MNLNQANVAELAANATRTTTLTATGAEVLDYGGTAQLVLQSTAGTGTTPTLDVKIQDSATLGGTYTDITGATFARVTDAADVTEMIPLNIGDVKEFIRVVGTIGGTTPSFVFGVSMIGTLQSGRNASQIV